MSKLGSRLGSRLGSNDEFIDLLLYVSVFTTPSGPVERITNITVSNLNTSAAFFCLLEGVRGLAGRGCAQVEFLCLWASLSA